MNEENKDCDCVHYKPLRPMQKGVVLACGRQDKDIVIDLGGILPTFPIEIAKVAVDTTCLCSPLILINFCSTIAVPEIPLNDPSTSVEYTFRLSRKCDNISKFTLEEFIFSRASITFFNILTSTNSFCFKSCDCDNICTGCCLYIVELVDIQVNGTPLSQGSDTTISKGIISAKAQGVCEK